MNELDAKEQAMLVRKAAAFDRLAKYAGGINYGGRQLVWGNTPEWLLQAIEGMDKALARGDA